MAHRQLLRECDGNLEVEQVTLQPARARGRVVVRK